MAAAVDLPLYHPPSAKADKKFPAAVNNREGQSAGSPNPVPTKPAWPQKGLARRSRHQVSTKPASRKKAQEAQKNAPDLGLGFCAFCAFLRLKISSRNAATLPSSSAKERENQGLADA